MTRSRARAPGVCGRANWGWIFVCGAPQRVSTAFASGMAEVGDGPSSYCRSCGEGCSRGACCKYVSLGGLAGSVDIGNGKGIDDVWGGGDCPSGYPPTTGEGAICASKATS